MADKRGKAGEAPAAQGVPFEQALNELEDVVKQMESAELPLEKALALFERGVELSESCRKQLSEAETRVEILMKKGETVEASPFDIAEE
ncbi:MAG: exodeoxyribonuclease VII small subunit [Candidatus Solibacter usitatus]|nr:exodeoxyribonuclease VII small subunit [Candidatus Solibacter usitatus]